MIVYQAKLLPQLSITRHRRWLMIFQRKTTNYLPPNCTNAHRQHSSLPSITYTMKRTKLYRIDIVNKSKDLRLQTSKTIWEIKITNQILHLNFHHHKTITRDSSKVKLLLSLRMSFLGIILTNYLPSGQGNLIKNYLLPNWKQVLSLMRVYQVAICCHPNKPIQHMSTIKECQQTSLTHN